MKMLEKTPLSKTELIIYKLTRDKGLSDEEKEIIEKIVENKDYKNQRS